MSPSAGGGSGGSAGSANNQGGTGGSSTSGGSGNASGTDGTSEGGQGLAFDSWIAEQDESVQTMLDSYVNGLKATASGEREARKSIEKQLKDLAGKAEKGSELERQLAEIAKANERAQTQADFYEQAHVAGVSNLKLAFIVAEQDQLIDGRGRVNFEEMRKRYPELFGGEKRQMSNGNAGAGTNQTTRTAGSMNDFIRAAAGRK